MPLREHWPGWSPTGRSARCASCRPSSGSSGWSSWPRTRERSGRCPRRWPRSRPPARAEPLSGRRRRAAARGAGRAPRRAAVEQVVLGNGADELIRLCAVATLDPGDARRLPVAVVPELPDGGALQRRRAGRGAAARPRASTSTRCSSGARPGTKLVYLANPNNPTGTLLDARRGARASSTSCPTACSACSTRPTPSTPTPSPRARRSCARARARLCVLRTFSKVYGLAALRVGYALASPRGGRRARPRAADLQREPAGAGGGARVAARDARRWRAGSATRAGRASELHERARRRPGSTRSRSQANFVYADVPGGDGDGLAGGCCERRGSSCARCAASARRGRSA